ncbi:MAG TPA: AMP-binding protein [Longimicrobiaceae bacterium]|nr:AMP-binding protein [Longimicrobiaceae bacterium]
MANTTQPDTIPPRSIGELLRHRAARSPDALALCAPGRPPLTYGALYALVERAAGELNALGLGRGAPVAVVLPNGPEMAAGFLATASCAVCAPLNPAYTADEFDFYLSDLGARALIVPAGSGSPAVAVAERHGVPVVGLSPVADAGAGSFALAGPAAPAAGRPGLSGPEDEALVLHTSGTTSRPKQVPLTHANLCASAHAVASTLRLGADDRCLNVMPLFHIHGLVGALLSSLAAGASVACTPGFYASDFFAWMEELSPTWYTAVPTIHQSVLARAAASRETLARAPLRFIRSSSSALPPSVMAEMERVFGVPVVESYGMTEAAHQMASNPLPPGERRPGSVGRAAGPEVAVMDASGSLLPPGSTGEVVIRGPSVTAGYRGDPAANGRAFSGGWLRTGDQGRLDADGYLYITGRIKELINRGGEKVAPREVDEALLEHPAVAQALAFAIPHPTLGEEVGAAVVLRPGAAATERSLREFALLRLAAFKVPRRIVVLDEIPRGPTGKLQRIGLASKLGVAHDPGPAAPAGEHTPPRSPVEELLAGMWAEVLGTGPVGVHDGFVQLGGDSMLAARLAARLRDELGVELPPLDFLDASTVAELAPKVEAQLLAADGPGPGAPALDAPL